MAQKIASGKVDSLYFTLYGTFEYEENNGHVLYRDESNAWLEIDYHSSKMQCMLSNWNKTLKLDSPIVANRKLPYKRLDIKVKDAFYKYLNSIKRQKKTMKEVEIGNIKYTIIEYELPKTGKSVYIVKSSKNSNFNEMACIDTSSHNGIISVFEPIIVEGVLNEGIYQVNGYPCDNLNYAYVEKIDDMRTKFLDINGTFYK